MNLFSSKYFFWIVLVIQATLFVVVKDDPFFGDSIASTSKAALAIYDSGFGSIFYPADVDPGHPTLYPIIMALSWTVFGQTLWVSHLLGIFCSILLLWSLRKVSLLFIAPPFANMVLLLACFFATFLSVSAMMLNTSLLMVFCLLAVYALLTQHKWLFISITSLMMLTHLQASFFLLALACADLAIAITIEKQSIWNWLEKRFIMYTIPFLVFVGWLSVHYQHAGWLFHSPNYSDADSLNGLGAFVKSLALIGWRLVDYGMLPIHLITLVAIFRRKIDVRLSILFVTMLFVTAIIMAITLEHTIGHRYFLVFQLLSILIAVSYLMQIQKTRFYIGMGTLSMGLLAGNFLYYPGKTIGDATLAYRSYFTIEQEIQEECGNTTFASYAPLGNPVKSRCLTEEGLIINRINSAQFDSIPAILQSNINTEFTDEEKQYLQQHWFGKSYERGAVYVTVFYNPTFYTQTEKSHFRIPSKTEQYIYNLKKRLSN